MCELGRWRKKRKSQGDCYQAAVPHNGLRRALQLEETFEGLLWGGGEQTKKNGDGGMRRALQGEHGEGSVQPEKIKIQQQLQL